MSWGYFGGISNWFCSDRFWFENGQFTAVELSNIQKTLLSDIILRNTDISSIQCYVMSKPDNCIRYSKLPLYPRDELFVTINSRFLSLFLLFFSIVFLFLFHFIIFMVTSYHKYKSYNELNIL